jgi:hypothetical protein
MQNSRSVCLQMADGSVSALSQCSKADKAHRKALHCRTPLKASSAPFTEHLSGWSFSASLRSAKVQPSPSQAFSCKKFLASYALCFISMEQVKGTREET